MAFRNYLEGEDDKPYFHLNSLAHYYEEMQRYAALIKEMTGYIKEYGNELGLTKDEIDQRVTAYILENKAQLDQRLGEWDEKLQQFDGSVTDLLAEWVDDGTLNHIIDTTLIDQKVAPLTAQLADTASKEEVEIERQRIGTILELPDGSTTNDARLEDIKIGADGSVYASPGDAVRKGISSVSDSIKDIAYEYKQDEMNVVVTPYYSGFWWDGAASSSTTYVYTDKFSVKTGDVISVVATGNPTAQPIRFVQAYNGNAIVADKSTSTDTTAFTVPEGVDGLIISLYSANQEVKKVYKKSLLTKHAVKVDRKNFCFTASATTLSANAELIAAKRIDNKKNCSYLFNGFFSSFGILKIGHGKTEYGSVHLTIDATNIKTYSATGSLFQTLPHGLTIKDFISVSIKVADTATARAIVTIRTNGGDSITENAIFFGSNGDIFATSSTVMTNVKFQYVVPDMKKDVFIFGDSYTSLADTARWPHYLLSTGYTNMMLNGFGGATSADALVTFKNIMDVQKPKYLVWLLGMNDPDTTVVNTSWKSTLDFVITYCKNFNITLILSTIPNTPTVNNMHKNEIVRTSSYRFIDFAKAVNAEAANAPWYAGMLSVDNVHPAEAGAKALASRILIDVPELIN